MAQRQLLKKSTMESKFELEQALASLLQVPSLQGTVDLIECCASPNSELTKAVEELGGKADRLGIWNCDLATRRGFEKAKQQLYATRPRHLFCSPPCDPFSALQNLNQRTEDQRLRHAVKLARGRRIWRHCMELCCIQISLGGAAHVEHPLRS